MLYYQIISIEHLFQAWDKFKKEKRRKKDVQLFERNLEDNLFLLHEKLKNKTYKHSPYIAFNIHDPKFRHIHKACVVDRIVHHAIVSAIEPLFDKTFINDSYSCRLKKGTHRAVRRLFHFVRRVSKNYTRSCFALKLDIKKFFESVDHRILLVLMRKRVDDQELLVLIEHILKSFSSQKGMPIGNLTSQFFANVYMNELDQFIKQTLRIKYYIRYADDFVILSDDRVYLEQLVSQIALFLKERLALTLHEDKIVIRKYTQGIDFLGYICLPYCIVPRTKTKRRIFKKLQFRIAQLQKGEITESSFKQTTASYLGFLKHANAHELTQRLNTS